MSRNIKLCKLLPAKNALKRKPDVIQASAVVSRNNETMWLAVNATNSQCRLLFSFHWQISPEPETVSPYFSPIQTRNKRKHIKIQTEETLTKKPISKIVAKAVIKQEAIDAIEAFASTSKPKEEIKLEKIDVKKEKVVVRAAETAVKREKVSSKKQKAKLEADEIKKEIIEAVPVNDEPLAEAKWQPKNWQQMIENIREMRKTRLAPVDTMGCHKCSDETASEKVIFSFPRFQFQCFTQKK